MFIPPSKGSPFISSPLECGLTLTSHTVTHGPHVKTSYTLHFYFLESSFCVKKSKISCMGNDVGREKPCGMRDHKREKALEKNKAAPIRNLYQAPPTQWVCEVILNNPATAEPSKQQYMEQRWATQPFACFVCGGWAEGQKTFLFSWPLWTKSYNP